MWGEKFLAIYYIFIWGGSRVRGCFRRWKQPLLRGPEWFFDVNVPGDFYTGEGRKVLDRYHRRIFVPSAIELAAAIAIFASGHVVYLAWLVLIMAPLVHIHHAFSMAKAEREARKLAVPEAEQPVTSVALSLTSRRLRDYTSPRLEYVMAITLTATFALLAVFYLRTHESWRDVFIGPAVFLYMQFGFLVAKQMVIAWRAPIPQQQAEEHMAAREESRKIYARMCDMSRLVLAVGIASWPILLIAPPASRATVAKGWLIAIMAAEIILGVRKEIMRKRAAKALLRARPVKLPDLMDQPDALRWPVCYQPSAPQIVLKGMRGYSLNFANRLTQLGAAYITGLVALFTLLRLGF